MPATGWWGLKNILDNQRQFDAQYNALPPDACPYCGSPLQVGQQTQSGGGRLLLRHCPLGHYTYTGGPRLT